MSPWFCWCPQMLDEGPCRAVSRIVYTFDLNSTSGPVLHVAVRCDAGHVFRMPFEDITLIA